MKPLKLIAIISVAILISLPSLAFAKGKPPKDDPPVDPTVVYTAELISGAFDFRVAGGASGAVSVTPISMGNELFGNDPLGMERSDGGLPETWNKVFNTCGELLALDSVTYFHVEADDWSIEKPGGVRVIFRDINLPGVDGLPGGKVTVQLIGDEFDDFLPPDPDPGETTLITHNLRWFAIYGRTQKGVHPKKGCQPSGSGSFDIYPFKKNEHSVLEIKATRQQ
jgi:hypothetical protein